MFNNLFSIPKESVKQIMRQVMIEINKKSDLDHRHGNYENSISELDSAISNHKMNTNNHVNETEKTNWNKKTGKQVSGDNIQYTYDKRGSAKAGAEIHNDYRERTYSSSGVPVTGNVSVGMYASSHGSLNSAIGDYSSTNGGYNTVTGMYAHADGCNNKATGGYSDVGGLYNIANNFQTVRGQYNKETKNNADYLIIGNGTSNTLRNNCFRMNANEGLFISGAYNTNGADYGEYFEWADGNPDNTDRIGRFVKLNGDKIELSESSDDDVIGIVSGNPSVIGDSFDDNWSGKYSRDIYNRIVLEQVIVKAETVNVMDPDDATHTIEMVVTPEHTEIRPKLSDTYDPNQEYIPRSQRKEWACIGMLGKLVVRDDETAVVGGYVNPSMDGIATKSETKTKYRVIKRLAHDHIMVLVVP